MTRLYALEGSGVGHAIALALSASAWYETLLQNYCDRTLSTWIESELEIAPKLPILKRHPLPCWLESGTVLPECESQHLCGFDTQLDTRDRIFCSTGTNWTQNLEGDLPRNPNNHLDTWCHTQFERIAEGLSVENCEYTATKHKIIDRINSHWPTLPVFSANPQQIISAPWILDSELDRADVEQLCSAFGRKLHWQNAQDLHEAYFDAKNRQTD